MRGRKRTIAAKWPRHRKRGRSRGKDRRINARRALHRKRQSRKCLCKSERCPPAGAHVGSKEPVRLFPPPSASSFFPHLPPSHLFGPPVFPCSVLLQLLGRAIPSTTLSRVFSEGRGGGEAGGNAVTRENPLRNVFGPCTARYYLQSRACIKYMCEERKEDARNFKRERFGTRRKLVTSRKCDARRRQRWRARENDSQIRFNYEPPTRTFFFFSAMNIYISMISIVSCEGI